MNRLAWLTGTPSSAVLATGGLTVTQRLALWHKRALALGAELLLYARLDLTGMTRRDRDRWASARTMADLGELVVAWLHGEIAQTPGHCAPPCDETIPLIPTLTLANRAGFITDNSQLAETYEGDTWNTWVQGFASDAVLARLRAAVAGTPLVLGACRGRQHDKRHHAVSAGWRCPWRDSVDFWSEACPAVAGDLRDSWYVTIEDPEPGRNHELWPALDAFSQTAWEVA